MAKLGPELFARLNAEQHVGNRRPVRYGVPGPSSEQFAAIEDQLGFGLPDDFMYLFGNLQDAGGVLFPWADFSKDVYDERIDCVWRGVAFDIEQDVWLDRWGARPTSLPEALEVAHIDFLTWPRLLPICGHRFLAAEPLRTDNPVFSIKQLDIIYYGADLAHYLAVEFLCEDYVRHTRDADARRIDVWSDFAESVCQPYRPLQARLREELRDVARRAGWDGIE